MTEPTPSLPAAIREALLAHRKAVRITELRKERDKSDRAIDEAEAQEATALTVLVAHLLALVEGREEAWRAIESAHTQAVALHRALRQDSASGDFGRALDERAEQASDLRLTLFLHKPMRPGTPPEDTTPHE
jgi:hypothetical protein